MQRISLLLAGFAPAALWAQRAAGTELWRVAATTLPLPPALGTGGAAAFWDPAQPAIPERASLALEVIETAPTVGASGGRTTGRGPGGWCGAGTASPRRTASRRIINSGQASSSAPNSAAISWWRVRAATRRRDGGWLSGCAWGWAGIA